jgi:UDP-N-acetylmuramate dehydrogenase
VSEEKLSELLARFPDMPHFREADGALKIPSAWLIERCGWKGKKEGKAGVHDKQALVLVNLGGASGAEIKALSDKIISSVEDKFGLRLEREVNIC